METKHSQHLEEVIAVLPPGRRFCQHAGHNLENCRSVTSSADGVGSCGDKIQVDLRVRDGLLEEVKCTPEGCLYTVACASAMSMLATGCSIEQALKLQPEDVAHRLGELPEDHLHCARLAINTLGDAIAEYYRKTLAIDRAKIGGRSPGAGKE